MLSNFYYDNAYYQENILPVQNKKDGHEVFIIASTENMNKGKLFHSKPGTYYSEKGLK